MAPNDRLCPKLNADQMYFTGRDGFPWPCPEECAGITTQYVDHSNRALSALALQQRFDYCGHPDLNVTSARTVLRLGVVDVELSPRRQVDFVSDD